MLFFSPGIMHVKRSAYLMGLHLSAGRANQEAGSAAACGWQAEIYLLSADQVNALSSLNTGWSNTAHPNLKRQC